MEIGIKVGDLAKIGNSAYEVLYVTNPRRCVVRYDGGTLVGLDLSEFGEGWELGIEAEDPGEKKFIQDNMQNKDTTGVSIVKDGQ